MLYGEGLKLDPLETEDIDEIMPYINDLEVNIFLSRNFPISKEEEIKWIRSVSSSEEDFVFAIKVRKKSNEKYKIIGTCGLVDISWFDRNATFGIQIFNKKFWGKGCGTGATNLLLKYGFRELGLNRITSWVIEYSEMSIALHDKVGFVPEGAQRKRIYKLGEYHDLLLFGLLRDEYLGLAEEGMIKY